MVRSTTHHDGGTGTVTISSQSATLEKAMFNKITFNRSDHKRSL